MLRQRSARPTTSFAAPGSAGAPDVLTAWTWAAAIGVRLVFVLGLGLPGDRTVLVSRVTAFTAGLVTLALTAALAEAVAGKRIARIALFVGAFSPVLLFASGFAAAPGLAGCALLGVVVSAWHYAGRRRGRALAVLGGVIVLAGFGFVSSFVQLPNAEPAVHPLQLPGSLLVTIAYHLPVTLLAVIGAIRGGPPARARAILVALFLGTVALTALRSGAFAPSVISTPYLVVCAALGLDRLLSPSRSAAAHGVAPNGDLIHRAGVWRLAAFGAGLALFALTAAGLRVPLQDPGLAARPRDWRRAISPMSERQVYEVLRSPAFDSTGTRGVYLERATMAVHAGLRHEWSEMNERFSMRVPVHENWILFALSWIHPARLRRYEFVDYRRALARGVGACSEHAIVTCDGLRAQGVPAGIVAFPGHVVATAQSDPARDRWSILDADLGVVIPYAPAEVASEPALADSAYRAAGYSVAVAHDFASKFAAGRPVFYASAAAYAHPRRWFVERASYVLIWLVPLLMMAPFVSWGLGPRLLRTSAHGDRVGSGPGVEPDLERVTQAWH